MTVPVVTATLASMASSAETVDSRRRFFGSATLGSQVRAPLLRGSAGEQQLVDAIMAAIAEGGKDDVFRRQVYRIVAAARPRGPHAVVRAWFDFLAHDPSVPYAPNPVDVQIIPSVADALAAVGLDCKGKTVVGGAGLEALGFPVRVVTCDQRLSAVDGYDPDHVYLEWLTPERTWKAFDPVLAEAFANAQPGQAVLARATRDHGRPPR